MENIKEKIQKLLNLATSDNEHEAALALAKATELMNKWNLEIGEVTGQKVKLEVYEFPFAMWTDEFRDLACQLLIISSIHALFQNGSKKRKVGAKMHISGRPRDIENFIYLFEFIRTKTERESQKYKLSIRKSGSGERNHLETKSFRIGFIDRICEKLRKSKSEFFSANNSLICIDSEVKAQEAQDFLYKQFENEKVKVAAPKTVTIASEHLQAGKSVADEIDLNVAINGKSQLKLEQK